MKSKQTLTIVPALLAAALVLGSALPASAQSADELLEKGIYTEQTVGDLSAAIEIYTRVVENAAANRPHAAQAQFRLGMCYLKSGKQAEAKVALDKLIQDFPEQKQLVAQAREELASVRPELTLIAAPWKDGESLRYEMNLPTGKTIGNLYLKAESAEVDGVDAWRLEIRRLVLTNADNYGVSRVLVNRHTQRPISSTVRHGVLGNADASYGPDGARITSGDNETLVESDQEIYDNEQSMHLMRMLPLAPGYTTRIDFLPTWTGQVLDTGIEVTGKETCQVPAGDFECYKVELDIGQTFWVSTTPERQVVKVKAGGVVVELAEIGQTRAGEIAAFDLEDFGFSGTLPTGWMTYEHRPPGRSHKTMLRFLDPEAASISAVEVDRCPKGECPPLEQSAERELSGAQERFDGYELREGSWTERTIDGRPAISFVGNYNRDGKPWVQYRLYTMTDKLRLEFIFRTPMDRFEGLRATFDSVARNLKAQ